VKPTTPLPLPVRVLWNAFFWTYERTTWQYDLMVIAILAFVWLTPPDWLGDPMATGCGPVGWIMDRLR
jgi:hypothetical protein